MRLFALIIFALIFTASLAAGSGLVFAQIPVGDFVQVEVSPETPRSQQNVTITVRSFSIDIQNSMLTWKVNGTQVAQGKGVTVQQVQTGKPGVTTVVDITIQTADGVSVAKKVTLNPGDVDIIWETDSYVPPFYKGRPWFTYQGELNLVAVPNFITKSGARIDPKTLVYTWEQDGRVLGSFSGYGKNSLKLKGGVLIKPTEIAVTVTGQGADMPRAETSMALEATEPEIVFYEESPLYGTLYNKAVGNAFTLRDSEATFTAVPYFFSNSSKNTDALGYTWSINNRERADLGETESITLRQKADVEGSSSVALTIKNAQDIFQEARKAFTVQFTKKASADPIEF